MSSRSFRRVLAGLLVTSFLSLTSPVSAKAVDLPALPDVPSLWAHAWQWLTEQMAAAGGGTDAAASAEVLEESKSDAGWTIDPNG